MDYRVIVAHLKIMISFSKAVEVKYPPALEVFLDAIFKRHSGTLKPGTMFMSFWCLVDRFSRQQQHRLQWLQRNP